MDPRNRGSPRGGAGLPGRQVQNAGDPRQGGGPAALLSSQYGNPPSQYGNPPPSQYGNPMDCSSRPMDDRGEKYPNSYGGAPQGQGMPRNSAPMPTSPGFSGGRPTPLRLAKVEDKNVHAQYIYTNITAVGPNTFPQGRSEEDFFVRLSGPMMRTTCVVTVRPTPGFPDGCISLSDPQRTWCGVSLRDEIMGEPFDPFRESTAVYLNSLDVEIDFASSKQDLNTNYDQYELTKLFASSFKNQVLAPGQKLLLDARNIILLATVKTVTLGDLLEGPGNDEPTAQKSPESRGVLTNSSEVIFRKAQGSRMQLQASTKRLAAKAIISPNFNFEELGIGGLDNQISTIFRRTFASRLLPPPILQRLNIKHVMGLLLYGPPGTGKTLIARKIGSMLTARPPKIVNGPEILSKYVGQSEENVRKLFAEAEAEYKEKGDDSELHVIIFDELDAVCKQRGSGVGGGTNVGDTVVNQLLAKLDGVDQLNNMLLIGMTNRKDMIDDALLRPGRIEVHLEITLPDEHGRRQILNIHTAKLRDNGVLKSTVSIDSLAARTKNFSGAEIAGLVRSATSFALSRHVSMDNMSYSKDSFDKMMVWPVDFDEALMEIKPAFGTDEGELDGPIVYGILHHSKSVQSIINDGLASVASVQNLERRRHLSVLLHGPKGSGKTALAAHIAKKSGFPYCKIVTPECLLVCRDEGSKKDHIHKVFTDAYKTSLSCVIIDQIEQLIEWNPVGLRLSNTVLQALTTLFRAAPPNGHRLLILATTSKRRVMQELGVLDAFDKTIPVPGVQDLRELGSVLKAFGKFGSDVDINEALNSIQTYTGQDVGLGVKTVLTIAESSTLIEDRVEWFAGQIASHIAQNNAWRTEKRIYM